MTEIQDIGDEYAGKISAAFQEWAESAKESYPKLPTFDPTPIILSAMMAAGAVQLSQLSELLSVQVKFDLKSPEAIAWAEKYGAQQVKYVSRATKLAIRQITASGLQDGLSPAEQSKAIRQIVGLLPQHAQAVLNYRNQLIKSGTDEALAGRLTDKYRKKLLKWRADTIGLTESHTAANEGLRQANRGAVERGILKPSEYEQEWLTSADKRRCDRCAGMQGKRASLPDGTFPGDGSGPILHPRCRCTTIIVRK